MLKKLHWKYQLFLIVILIPFLGMCVILPIVNSTMSRNQNSFISHALVSSAKQTAHIFEQTILSTNFNIASLAAGFSKKTGSFSKEAKDLFKQIPSILRMRVMINNDKDKYFVVSELVKKKKKKLIGKDTVHLRADFVGLTSGDIKIQRRTKNVLALYRTTPDENEIIEVLLFIENLFIDPNPVNIYKTFFVKNNKVIMADDYFSTKEKLLKSVLATIAKSGSQSTLHNEFGNFAHSNTNIFDIKAVSFIGQNTLQLAGESLKFKFILVFCGLLALSFGIAIIMNKQIPSSAQDKSNSDKKILESMLEQSKAPVSIAKKQMDMSEELSSKDTEIEELNSEIEMKDDIVMKLRAEIKGKDDKIANFNGDNQEYNNSIKKLQDEVSDRQKQIDSLNLDITKLKQDYTELKNKAEQKMEQFTLQSIQLDGLNKTSKDKTQPPSSDGNNTNSEQIKTILDNKFCFYNFLTDVNYFFSMLKMKDDFFANIEVQTKVFLTEFEQLYQNASFFSLQDLQQYLQACLKHFTAIASKPDGDVKKHYISIIKATRKIEAAIDKFIQENHNYINVYAWKDLDYHQSVSSVNIRDFYFEMRKQKIVPNIINSYVDNIYAMPAEFYLKHYNALIQDTAHELGKKVLPLKIEGGNTRLVGEFYYDLFYSFTYALRFALFYGIEAPDIRTSANKPEEGLIRIIVSIARNKKKQALNIIIADDGKGIPANAIRKNMESIGLADIVAQENDEEIIQHVLDSGFSTKAGIIDLTGANIGLNAIKVASEELGGRTSIMSDASRGTRVVIDVPLIEYI
ncbi:MAG: hypothetical protein ISR65_05545 [Bacteriovoracaceae bacterium]|nr:hypothetical protein [Bacteriovoracaceae bacterium]